jgi:hypothetical protein
LREIENLKLLKAGYTFREFKKWDSFKRIGVLMILEAAEIEKDINRKIIASYGQGFSEEAKSEVYSSYSRIDELKGIEIIINRELQEKRFDSVWDSLKSSFDKGELKKNG